MNVAADFLLGCNGRGPQASSINRPVSLVEYSIDERFRMVKEAGVFDYVDRLPMRSELDEYLAAIAKYDLPVHTGGWSYMVGRDDALIADNLRVCKEVGASCHNMMTYAKHADGHVLSDDEVVRHYLEAWETGIRIGVEPSFEVHVNVWSENFRRVTPVARRVRAHGIPFNLTMDYSHVVFKIGNSRELDISGVREDVEAGRMILDPLEEGSLCDEWLDLGIVRWAQMRPVAPNQPMNLWCRNDPSAPVPDILQYGEYARGIQYPMIRPAPDEWHSPWNAYLLEPSKEAIRKTLRHHIKTPTSRLKYITTEMINLPDYGMGAKYNLFENNVACARFIRKAWAEVKALHAAGLL
ncbi:MAG: xylose isomerase [Proteobacteria bacterium]|nr:xylose isomerase [Pseudomonadota bacterium]